jgi:hypothetical protein
MADTNLKKNKQGYGYKYTDLAEIHNYLEENNSRYIQKIERVDGDDYIYTKRATNDVWEDEWLQGCRVVQATLSGKSNPAQEQGSALTYARRYSLLMAFGLATEDDDAQSLSKKIDENVKNEFQVSEKVTELEAKTVYGLIMNKKRDLNKFLEYFKIKNTNELTKSQYVEALKMLEGGN